MEHNAYIFDVDGTLIDSNYHHALAWFRAFRDYDMTVPLWRLHRTIGMGGDLFVAHVTDEHVESEYGDRLRDAWTRHFDLLIGEVQPFEDAADVIRQVKRAGATVALASSGAAKHVTQFLALLDVDDCIDVMVTSDDVERSKPYADLVEVALERVGQRDAVMVGDSVWDCKAATGAGVEVVGTLGGGFGAQELLDEGATFVVHRLSELLDS